MKSTIKYRTAATALFSSALLLGLFTPEGTVGNLILGLLPLVLFFFLVDKRQIYPDKYFIIFFAIIICSLASNVIFFDSVVSWKPILRLFSFGLLFLLFPFCGYVKTPVFVIFLSLLFILLSLVAYAYGISPLVSFFDTVYTYTGDQRGFQSDYLLSGAGDVDFITNRRYGGLYHNPNQCVRYVCLLLIIFLIEYSVRTKVFAVLIILVYLSVVLSGSRTGFVVVSGLLLYRFLFYENSGGLKSSVVVSLILVGVLALVFYITLSSLDLRMFDISSGAEGSLGAKFSYFMHFFRQLDSPLRFLFGHFSNEDMWRLYGVERLDSEWGELFYNFGFLGSLSLIVFYVNLWKTKNDKIRFFMLLLFWGITSTVIFSFRMSFLFMLLLSSYYSYHFARSRRDVRYDL